jgi:tRNA dimethylallyltransferase
LQTGIDLGEIRIGSFEHIETPLEQKKKQDQGQRREGMLFIAGPTGCGKTEISILLAKAAGGEIVSADSMQVYRGMNIGTAKATLAQQAEVPHHMIDVVDITDHFSVVDFYYGAQEAIEDIQSRGKLPIIVGGAGFYLHSLIYGPPAGPPSVDSLRRQLEQRLQEEGADALYQQLQEQDPTYASTITPHDRHKIVRALEIIALTDAPVSELSWKGREPILHCPHRCWFLYRPRFSLYKRVEERCDAMIAEGLLDEVETLSEKGLRENSSVSQAIGYKQALAFLDSDRSDKSYARFIKEFKKASRRYVKRQFTWFRKEPLFQWVNVDLHDPEVVVDEMIKEIQF